MPAHFQGSTDFNIAGTALVQSTVVLDPETGYQSVDEYEGTPDGITALANTLRNLGARCTATFKAGKALLAAQWRTQTGVTEAPVDQWQIGFASYQAELWRHPKVMAEGNRFNNGADVGMAAYRGGIENQVTDRKLYLYPVGTYPVGLHVHQLLSQNTGYFEGFRVTIRRQRAFSTAYPGRVIPSTSPYAYLRPTLISTFAIPLEFANQIPPNPAPITGEPDYMVWAWRLTQQSSSYVPAYGRWEENTDFELWQWDNVLYDIL